MERLIDAARRHEDQSLRDDVVVVAIERPVPISWGAPRHPRAQPVGAPSEDGAAAEASRRR